MNHAQGRFQSRGGQVLFMTYKVGIELNAKPTQNVQKSTSPKVQGLKNWSEIWFLLRFATIQTITCKQYKHILHTMHDDQINDAYIQNRNNRRDSTFESSLQFASKKWASSCCRYLRKRHNFMILCKLEGNEKEGRSRAIAFDERSLWDAVTYPTIELQSSQSPRKL